MNQNVPKEDSAPLPKPNSAGIYAACLALAFGLLIAGVPFATHRRISYLLYYLNWFHWPRWYSINLWILAFGAAANYYVRGKKTRRFLFAGVPGAIFVVTAFYSAWLPALVYRLACLFKTLHYSVFRPYFYAPLTEFFSSGTVTGRLFIVPGAGIALIAAVLFFRRAVRRNKNSDSPLRGPCENNQHENRQKAENNT